MALVRADLISYADLQRKPDDGRQYELYNGEVRVVPPPTNRHQMVLRNLFLALLEYERRFGGRVLFAPSDVVLSDYNVIQPDLLYFTETRRHLLHLDEPTRAAPDLIIEVVSPGSSAVDRGRKQAVCARFGVLEYWLADPFEETIEVFAPDGSGYRLAQTAGPGHVAASPSIDALRVATGRVFDLG